ncbi:hypothetical protein ABT297_04160 [Dactylosporangium sp. NPDC000555]|uniref:hypothetical protein n=1 Tax=Dactylosporangium sp. NPDC000555 TaxID=3154260 RepID=UPI0033315B90
MTPEETLTLARIAVVAYDRPMPDGLPEIWHAALGDLQFGYARDALMELIRTSPYWPKPSDIRGRALEAERERRSIERQQREAEEARALAASAQHTEDRSNDVVDLVAAIRARLPENDPRKLRPRQHAWRQRQRGNVPGEANPLYRVPPPGGHPVPGDDEPSGLGAAIVDTFAAGWPKDERRTS